MKYYFDESGIFRPTANGDAPEVGIVVGVAIPDDLEASLFRSLEKLFRTFAGKCDHGELKGHRLPREHRTEFCQFLAARGTLIVCPSVLDLRLPADLNLVDGLASTIRDASSLCKHARQREELELLSKQVSNLSTDQLLRLVAWSRCALRSIQDSLVYFCESSPETRWDLLTFSFDAVQPRSGSREEQVFHALLPNWIVSATLTEPITLIEEVHNEGHPLIRNYCAEGGVDVGKMLSGNVRFASSKRSTGIQLADMTAAVIRCAMAHDAEDEDVRNYARLMSRALRGGLDCVGIFSVGTPQIAEWERRYLRLIQAVEFASQFRV